jgi:tetratricopeptide (TPR) repeat protein
VDGVHSEPLVLLSPGVATALLARIAGDRFAAEPEAAAEMVRRCGGLPLALRLAGARLAHRRRWGVADLVRRLGESALPELAVEDRSVADAFALSYGQLAAPAQRMFRLLGVYPAPLFDALAAAALAGLPIDETQNLLDDLNDVHLVDEPEPGIFRLHDLLREYAAALAGELPPEAAEAVLDLQTHALAAALPPIRRIVLPRDFGPYEPLRPDLLAALTDPAARLEWERPQLSAYVEAAGETKYAWWIPRAAWWHLYNRGYSDDLRALLEQSCAVVEKADDRHGMAVVANYLASVYVRTADLPRALEMLERSVRIHQEAGNQAAYAIALGNRAPIYEAVGRFADGVASAAESLRLRALLGERGSCWTPLHNLAQGYARLGRHEESLHYRRRALLTAIENGDTAAIAVALLEVQTQKRALGQTSAAMTGRFLTAALRLARRSGHRGAEADIVNKQGILLRDLGRYAEATALHEAAIGIMRQTSERLHEAVFTLDLATTRALAGDRTGALALHRWVLRRAQALGAAYLAACAEAGIAGCLADTDPEPARRSWTAALAAFREMGVPEQYEVERRLAAMTT